MGKDKDPADPQ